ncbi:hypothetical protein [Flavobacterium sp. H122]|uniref:hypothetical protein n=1 Tax=Flavobacterium sp. H122 TaxID=2529860 RepID=UPI0010A9D6E6|nr:hypothetical protein [Flavobacterium sp. H122]
MEHRNLHNEETLFDKAENYVKTSMDLFKLQLIDKSSDLIATLATKIVIVLIVSMFLFFMNIGFAIWIGQYLNNLSLGFIIISSFYLIVSIFMYCFRHRFLKFPISDMIIRKLTKSIDLDNYSN